MSPTAAGDDQLKRALHALTEMRHRLEAAQREKTEPIAVVGIGCRLPGGVDTPEAFWTLLRDGVDAVTEVPKDRWDADALYDKDPEAPGKVATRWGGFLQDVEAFDASFFGISPREAARMDPQQRLLLEVAWEALEHAGQSAARLAGTATGVFIGVHSHSIDYWTMQLGDARAIEGHSGTGTSHSVLAGRLSYLLDLRGPSLAIDTACSSSLVATHLACQSLRSGECSTALVGGVNLILSPEFTMAASRLQMLAADGRCKAFDARADGFVRAEGCAVVVLKRLTDALAAGDPVLAVIRGSAVNQDGKTNGLTAPSGTAQQAVIREAFQRAGVTPADIDYIEAHGTGTPLGDPIEVEALAAVLGPSAPAAGPCLLGSVKTNLGHLEGAAGIVGLIKVVLALRHQAVPPHLHLTRLNPHMSLEGTRLRVPTTLVPWPRRARRRCAGVSAFGWSGTNAHVVVEEAPLTDAGASVTPEPAATCELLPISARGGEALANMVRRYESFLTSPTAPLFGDVCATAALRRSHHPHRAAVLATSAAEAAQRLGGLSRGEAAAGTFTGFARPDRRGRLAFVFSGQGSQWLGMGRGLLEGEPAFREALERCDAAIARHASWSLLAQLAADERASRLDAIDVVQPTLFAIAVALAALWRSWGVEPDAVIGHSMGEIAAAHVAGALSLDDAARVICRRSQLLRQISGKGAMAVIDLPRSEAEPALRAYQDRLSIAVTSSPRSTVVSGDPAALEQLLAGLRARDVFCRRVNVDVASHSPQIDPLLAPLRAALDGLAPHDAHVPMYSTVSGARCAGRELDAGYWARNLREPVLFSTALERLGGDGHTAFLELSPHPLLSAAMHETLEPLGVDALVLASLRRDEDERAALLSSAAALWTAGHRLEWERLSTSGGKCVALPAYAWQRERFWIDRADDSASGRRAWRGSMTAHPVLGSRVELADQPERRVWELALDASAAHARYHHRLGSTALVAAAAHVGVMLSAVRSTLGDGPLALRDVEFRHALVVPQTGSVPMQVTVVPDGDGRVRVGIFTRTGSSWVCHSTATAERSAASPDAVAPEVSAPGDGVAGTAVYEDLAGRGIGIAQRLQLIDRLWSGDSEAVATLTAPAGEADDPWRELTVLDVCFQLPALVGQALVGGVPPAVPKHVDEVRVLGDAGRARRSETRRRSGRPGAADSVHDVRLIGESGRAAIELTGLHLVSMPGGLTGSPVAAEQAVYAIQWRPVASQEPVAVAGTCVILGDDGDLTAALVQRLAARGARCVVITPGERYTERGSGRVVVDPTSAADIARGLDACIQPGERLTAVVSLWGLLGGDVAADDVAPCHRTLSVLQSLTRLPAASPTKLWLVTCGAQAVRPSPPIALSQSPLWGLGRVIAEEHPDLWGGLIDLDPSASPDDRAACVAEAVGRRDGDDQLAYRDGRRHVARLVRSGGGATGDFTVRADGRYLVTGGLGALGLEVARWLARRGAGHLTLVSRTPLPPRARWDESEIAPDARARIAAVRELETLGARVHLAAVDVGDDEVLGRLVAELRGAAPPLRGVVHAAAAIDDRLLVKIDAPSLERVWRGKVRGAWALHRALQDAPLDFFVLFASLGGVLGQAGQGSYAAANAFLDALAHHRRAHGQVALSVDWGAWAGLGFAATEGGRRVIADLESHGVHPFSPAQALDVLELALGLNAPQVIAVAIDWARLGATTRGAARVSSLLADLVERGAPTAADGERTLRALPLAERRTRLEEYVRSDLASILKLAPSRVDAHVPLGTLGLDSLTTLELRRRLERRIERPLPATLAWNYPTVADMAGYLANLLNDGRLAAGDDVAARPVPEPAVGVVAGLTEDEALRALLATRRRS